VLRSEGSVPTGTIMSEVYDRLRGEILSCTLRPGQRININEFALRFDVSLSAVREALSRLHSEQLVVLMPQRGYRVASVNDEEFKQLIDARLEVEISCLRQAMKRGDVNWETRVVATQYKLSRLPVRSPDDSNAMNPEWATAHAEFHAVLVEACGNRWLLNVRQMLFEHSERYRRLTVPTQSQKRDITGEHNAIAAAAIARDEALACHLFEEHLRKTERDTVLQREAVAV
jgi:GntR family carbon starvation induced transcriptional regulator